MRTHLAPSRNIPAVNRKGTDPQDLEHDGVAVRERVLYLIALLAQYLLAAQCTLEHLGEPASRAGRDEAVREFDLFDVGREERRELVTDSTGFDGRQIAPCHFEIRHRLGR